MKGLNKAERHEIKQYVRRQSHATALELTDCPRWFYRIVRAEIVKRRWVPNTERLMWTNPRWRP